MEQVLEFTKRYHDILAAINAVQFDLTKNPVQLRKFADDGIKEAAAHELYRQFFGLMFDEFVAYQHGFLGRDAFTKWMKWRNVDASKFEILGCWLHEGMEQLGKTNAHYPLRPMARGFAAEIAKWF